MALGKKLFQWDYRDVVKGISSSDGIPDGGFSSSTDAVQVTNTPGVMYQSSFPTDKSTGLTGSMIASCEDPTGNYKRLYVSASSSNGRFYSLDSSNDLTVRGSTDSTNQYIQGKTDMIAYDSEAYITNNATLVRWSSIGSSNTFDLSFFTFSDALSPHPALTFNNYAYYGDGNILLRQNGAGNAPVAILTLATSVIIVALGLDPGSGNILLSLIGQINLSDGLNSGASIAFYDGFSSQVLRYVQVDDMVTAFAPTEGALYCSYGQNLGQWNGSGITFLRHLNVAFDNTELLYKHHFTSIGSTLMYIQKTTIMAYGPVRQKGDNIFYPALVNPLNSNNFSEISNIGQNLVSISFATSKFYVWDTFTISGTSNSLQLFTNSYDFDDEVWIRRIRVIYNSKVPSTTSPGTIAVYNEDGIVTNVGDLSTGTFALTNTSGAASAYKDILNINVKVKMAQLKLLMQTGNYGVRRIICYGDPANLTGTPN